MLNLRLLSALFEAKYFSYGIVDAILIKIALLIEDKVSGNMFIGGPTILILICDCA